MEKKMRYSQQRDMIYEYLRTSHEHPSADMIYEGLKKSAPNLSLGTVYRNLRVLEEMGKIRRVTTLQNVERYDAVCLDHAHFVCEKCGCIKDLAVLDAQKESCSCCVASGDEIHWMNTVFGGICSACAEEYRCQVLEKNAT